MELLQGISQVAKIFYHPSFHSKISLYVLSRPKLNLETINFENFWNVYFWEKKITFLNQNPYAGAVKIVAPLPEKSNFESSEADLVEVEQSKDDVTTESTSITQQKLKGIQKILLTQILTRRLL